jgi:hypothetical protein
MEVCFLCFSQLSKSLTIEPETYETWRAATTKTLETEIAGTDTLGVLDLSQRPSFFTSSDFNRFHAPSELPLCTHKLRQEYSSES